MQNRHGELTIICKAKDLVNHTLQLTNNTKLFPKKVRFTLCQRMQNLSIQILHDIIAANEIYPRTVAEMNTRLDLQKEVLTNCKVFLNFLDIALEQGYIDIRRTPSASGSKFRPAAHGDDLRGRGCVLYVHPPGCALSAPRIRRTRTTCAT